MRFLAVLLGLLFSLSVSANAAVPAPSINQSAPGQPDLISFGLGYSGFDKTEAHTHAMDYRLEYRFGYAFLGGQEWGFHPTLGAEIMSDNLIYGNGGFAFDWNFTQHGIFTWTETIGYLDSGDHRSLGGTFQFRSGAEAGYRFDNNMRITAEFSHISDAKLTRINPGAEIIGIYVHVPTMVLFGAAK